MDAPAGIEIRGSQISGRGVFATRAFRSGEIVLRWDRSVLVSHDKVAEIPTAEMHFLVPFDQNHYLKLTGAERFVNHSCHANTRSYDFCDVAVRDIAPGEEITADYGLDNSASVGFQCNCKAVNCREWIGPVVSEK